MARGPHFNLSHAGRFVTLALADEPVGVDVEPMDYSCGAAERVFTEREIAYVGDGSTARSRTRFARIWTEKEAILKARGTGFALDPRRHPESLEGWHCETVEWQEHVISCAQRTKFEVYLFEVRLEEVIATLRASDAADGVGTDLTAGTSAEVVDQGGRR